MPEQIDVYYDGWGEHWRWGRLASSTALTGRPLIAFEYSDEALNRGLELSAMLLPLKGPAMEDQDGLWKGEFNKGRRTAGSRVSRSMEVTA